MALGPTQPPTQKVLGAPSLGVKRLDCEAEHLPPSSTEVKEWVELYLHSPNTPSLGGAQLKKDIWEILASYLNQVTAYPDWYSWLFFSLTMQMLE
jgi:hypothetical protein